MDHAISDERTVVNVATRLSQYAQRQPQQIAVVETSGQRGRPRYRSITFANLDADSNRIASGLRNSGIAAGTRIALLVRPGIDFVALVFGLFKCGAVAILIDPGTGRRNMVRCLAEAKPEGFIAIPAAQAIRTLLRHRFP
ncbi:MAG: AMP-binding protein [Pirellulales bacterium]